MATFRAAAHAHFVLQPFTLYSVPLHTSMPHTRRCLLRVQHFYVPGILPPCCHTHLYHALRTHLTCPLLPTPHVRCCDTLCLFWDGRGHLDGSGRRAAYCVLHSLRVILVPCAFSIMVVAELQTLLLSPYSIPVSFRRAFGVFSAAIFFGMAWFL